LAVTERLKDEVLSLPMHPYLTAGQLDQICGAVRAVLG
jgi:dTDP-4-amino-4,6-dideoxygalactose transaminase